MKTFLPMLGFPGSRYECAWRLLSVPCTDAAGSPTAWPGVWVYLFYSHLFLWVPVALLEATWSYSLGVYSKNHPLALAQFHPFSLHRSRSGWPCSIGWRLHAFGCLSTVFSEVAHVQLFVALNSGLIMAHCALSKAPKPRATLCHSSWRQGICCL